MGVRKADDFRRWVDIQCPWFPIVQDIANGSKHFRATSNFPASVAGWGEGMGYLALDGGGQMPPTERFQPAGLVLEVVVRFGSVGYFVCEACFRHWATNLSPNATANWVLASIHRAAAVSIPRPHD